MLLNNIPLSNRPVFRPWRRSSRGRMKLCKSAHWGNKEKGQFYFSDLCAFCLIKLLKKRLQQSVTGAHFLCKDQVPWCRCRWAHHGSSRRAGWAETLGFIRAEFRLVDLGRRVRLIRMSRKFKVISRQPDSLTDWEGLPYSTVPLALWEDIGFILSLLALTEEKTRGGGQGVARWPFGRTAQWIHLWRQGK